MLKVTLWGPSYFHREIPKQAMFTGNARGPQPASLLSHLENITSQHVERWDFIYLFLFLAALGLHCCTRAFSSCDERGLLFVVVRGLLTPVASLVAEHGF